MISGITTTLQLSQEPCLYEDLSFWKDEQILSLFQEWE